MNIPVILDIAIGLIFVYLILSLIASELQEIIATVLQWRAKHLKESIEILLAGDSNSNEQIKRARQLVNKIYTNPLIENINQKAKGNIVKLPRQVTWKIGKIYREISKEENLFGDSQHTGPSYIPSETFATTLLETLKIPTLVQLFTVLNLNNFKEELLNQIQQLLVNVSTIFKMCNIKIDKDSFSKNEAGIQDIDHNTFTVLSNFNQLQSEYRTILEDFKNQKATLNITIVRMEERLKKYIILTQELLEGDCKDFFKYRSQNLIKCFEKNERDVLIRGMKPSLTQVVEVVKNEKIFTTMLESIRSTNTVKNETIQEIQEALATLPESVRESISTLAHRAQSRVELTETDINQLRKEIELWFDRSMERASGVYKRNAKGIAILIGFVIALVANADTFYMLGRLSKDSDLRNAIAQNAQAVTTNCSTAKSDTGAAQTQPTQLDCIRDKTNEALEKVALPFGWSANTITEQWRLPSAQIPAQRREQWNLFGWSVDTITKQKTQLNFIMWSTIHIIMPVLIFFLLILWAIKLISKQKIFWLVFLSICTVCLVVFTGLKVVLGVILGWLLSAVAISMGAQFWFELLGKVINVRNTGPIPKSDTKDQPPYTGPIIP